ncbi:probable glutathione S-transferase 6 [Acanthaster planci]|uniref:glutathione transferase n=1 Tax=Acanthaster planci TaxID=133434 RepID=A0A8B7Y585_ACAPL|nr:probable glutathione S-transferase 6 [Acanthaster planci]
MVKYVLHYFKGQVRGESIRLAFKLAEVDFEEKNFDFSEWPTFKPNYPTQQVPVLEVDGKMIGQSKAILRWPKNSITITDLFFFTAVDFVDVMSRGANSLEKFPKLGALKSRIAANPKIAAWLAVRPPDAGF